MGPAPSLCSSAMRRTYPFESDDEDSVEEKELPIFPLRKRTKMATGEVLVPRIQTSPSLFAESDSPPPSPSPPPPTVVPQSASLASRLDGIALGLRELQPIVEIPGITKDDSGKEYPVPDQLGWLRTPDGKLADGQRDLPPHNKETEAEKLRRKKELYKQKDVQFFLLAAGRMRVPITSILVVDDILNEMRVAEEMKKTRTIAIERAKNALAETRKGLDGYEEKRAKLVDEEALLRQMVVTPLREAMLAHDNLLGRFVVAWYKDGKPGFLIPFLTRIALRIISSGKAMVSPQERWFFENPQYVLPNTIKGYTSAAVRKFKPYHVAALFLDYVLTTWALEDVFEIALKLRYMFELGIQRPGVSFDSNVTEFKEEKFLKDTDPQLNFLIEYVFPDKHEQTFIARMPETQEAIENLAKIGLPEGRLRGQVALADYELEKYDFNDNSDILDTRKALVKKIGSNLKNKTPLTPTMKKDAATTHTVDFLTRIKKKVDTLCTLIENALTPLMIYVLHTTFGACDASSFAPPKDTLFVLDRQSATDAQHSKDKIKEERPESMLPAEHWFRSHPIPAQPKIGDIIDYVHYSAEEVREKQIIGAEYDRNTVLEVYKNFLKDTDKRKERPSRKDLVNYDQVSHIYPVIFLNLVEGFWTLDTGASFTQILKQHLSKHPVRLPADENDARVVPAWPFRVRYAETRAKGKEDKDKESEVEISLIGQLFSAYVNDRKNMNASQYSKYSVRDATILDGNAPKNAKDFRAALDAIQAVFPFASVPIMFDVISSILQSDPIHRERINRFDELITETQRQLRDLVVEREKEEHASLSTKQIYGLMQDMYVPNSAYMSQPLISGHASVDPQFFSLLEQARHYVNMDLRLPHLTMEMLTDAGTLLCDTFLDLLAALEQRLNIWHPREYKKDKEFPLAFISLTEAGSRLREAAMRIRTTRQSAPATRNQGPVKFYFR